MKDIMHYKGFLANVSFSSEDEVFHGKILGIDDSVTFEGESVKELKSAFESAVEDYLDICKQAGKDPHKSFKGSFNVRIQPELHQKAVYKSYELGLTLNQFVEQAIRSMVARKQ